VSRLENIALVVLLIVLCLAVLTAAYSAIEALDTWGCRWDCKRAGMKFSRYEFRRNHCWGLLPSGEHQLY